MPIKIKHLFLTLIVLFSFLPLGFAQGTRPMVRIIYFLPSDREPHPDIDEKMNRLIKKVQQAYGDQMEAHGFGRKTFKFETDATGKAVVHHVVGRFGTRYYRNLPHVTDVWEEIEERFDTSKNFYITAMDISTRPADPGVPGCGFGDAHGGTGGRTLIPASGQCLSNGFDVWLTAHELGHAFGLKHDLLRTDGTWIPTSYTDDSMITSFCAAEWLDVHSAFNPGKPSLNENQPSGIKMLLSSFVSSPNTIRLRFELTDPDGLHQAQLLQTHDMLGYKRVNGTSGTVEFVTTELTLESKSVSLQVIDISGNFTRSGVFSIDIKRLLPPSKVISIPDPNLAAAVRREIGNITTHTIPNLTLLEVPNHGITDLTGLEHAHNLRRLYLDNYSNNVGRYVNPNTISDFSPLAGLTKLRTLSLSRNGLTDVYVLAGLTQLQSLNLNGNALTDISALAGLTQLQWLSLGRSNLSDISALASLTQLRRLYLSSNSLTDISVLASLTELRVLNLSQNSLTDISALASLTELRVLPLNRNVLTDISVLAGLTQLISLGLDNNTIADVSPLVDLQELAQLDLRGNPLSYAAINTHIRAMQAKGIEVRFVNRARSALLKISGDGQYGAAGEALSKPFVVEAMDARGKPMRGKSVTFTVTAGGGSLNTTTVTTNANGRARATFTLGRSSSKHTIRVSARGIRAPVTFTTYAAGPPIYWIDKDNGTLHRSIGSTVENLVPSVRNATRLLVDVAGGKLYWTEKIGRRSGKIRRADFNGTNVELVKNLTIAPRDIAIDAVNGKLYLTNAWGKVQRLNVDGSNFKPNFITGLDSPESIAVDMVGGKLYWTEKIGRRSGKIRRADLNGTNVELVKNLTIAPWDIAIDTVNGKLYLTNAWGKIQRLDFNGSNFKPNFITGLDSPESIAVDVVGGKLYWTATDSISCANLRGENIQNISTGLRTPGDFVLGISPTSGIAAPVSPMLAHGQTVSPNETDLLANYPNPFNPETWIPYQLIVPAEVTLHIYSVNGVLVRTLALGHQPTGVYHDKSRAAYWDGRNEQGERVASGIYFYTFSAGDFTATRKMLIQK